MGGRPDRKGLIRKAYVPYKGGPGAGLAEGRIADEAREEWPSGLRRRS